VAAVFHSRRREQLPARAAQEASKDSTEKHKRLDVRDEVPPASGGAEVVVEGTSQLSESPSETACRATPPSPPRSSTTSAKVVSTMQFYTPEERDGMLQS